MTKVSYDSLVATLMVQGVSSDAGKSFVATALCRWFRRQGVRVAPFKAQNMSNNARVVDGGEIGVAQWLQALAAGITPDVRMNPILLKPESDVRSQVVVNGVVDHELTASPWRGRSTRLWPYVADAFASLSADYDVILIEGAGSPAETNLWADDIANMAVAVLADAPVLLVADIDRGGAFAHLFGTWSLLPPPWRRRVEGFVLNKFRGDPALLAPAPDDLEERCGVPTLGVLPWLHHSLPAEEGPTAIPSANSGPRVVVLAGPFASNLDEFVQLQRVASVRWVRTAQPLSQNSLIILPGSKNVPADLTWLRETGLDREIRAAVRRGTPVLGVCGGLQMLGTSIVTTEPGACSITGLGLLPLTTRYRSDKRTSTSSIDLHRLDAPWSWLGGRKIMGYEIRQGVTSCDRVLKITQGDHVFGSANVLGVYLHGIFEDPVVLRAFCGSSPGNLEATFDQLADAVDQHLDTAWLHRRLGTSDNGR